MLALANLAGVDAETALLDLNIWRARSEGTRDKYRAILAKLTAALITVIAFGTTGEQVSLGSPDFIHYAIFRRRKRSTNPSSTVDRVVSRYRAVALSPRAAT